MSNRLRRTIAAGVCLLILGLIAVLHVYVRMAADDFYYAGFFNGGLREFINNTVYHYKYISGRAFVHIFLSPTLLFNMIPFRILNVFLIGLFTYLSAKLATKIKGQLLYLWAISLALFPLMGVATLSDGALWGAGSFNYLFPATLVVLYYLLLKTYSSSKYRGLLLTAAFFSAATVEMSGILIPITVLYVFFSDYAGKKRHLPFFIANFIAACAGYATLFGTGGIGTRLEQNSYFELGIFERAFANFELFSRMALDGSGIFIVITLLIALIGFRFLFLKKPLIAWVSFIIAALPLLSGSGIVYGSIGIAVIALICAVCILAFGIHSFASGERVAPFFILLALISLGICLIAPIIGMRMLLPVGIYLSIAALSTLTMFAKSDKLLCVSGVSSMIPAALVLLLMLTKFVDNAAVIDRNTLAAQNYDNSGVLYLQNVPDESYGAWTVPSETNFGENFSKLYGIEARIENFDAETKLMYSKGRRLSTPAIKRDGQWYITVRDIGELLSAETRWEYACAVIDSGEEMYRFHLNSLVMLTEKRFGTCYKLSAPVRMVSQTSYISVNDANRLFGLKIAAQA